MSNNTMVSSRSYEIPSPKTPNLRSTKSSNEEVEEIRCMICMEYPYKAVLLICSSYDKGCRPFMCNSLCQFNCLGQYYRGSTSAAAGDIRCPLCRGHVSEERAMESGAREFLDRKTRSCERCEFVGDRKDLEKHWWVVHSAELAGLIYTGNAVRVREVDRAMSAYATSTDDREKLLQPHR